MLKLLAVLDAHENLQQSVIRWLHDDCSGGSTYLAVDAFAIVEDRAQLSTILFAFEFDLLALFLSFETNFYVDGCSSEPEKGRHGGVDNGVNDYQ